MNEKEKICVKCHEVIDTKQRHVLLGTYKGKEIMDESWFHFNCFVKFHSEKVNEKAMNTILKAGNIASGMVAKMIGDPEGSNKKEITVDVGV